MNFPNESRAYRHAREELLEAEIRLRRNIEAVAALRRALPPGGVAQDYVFDAEAGKVRLSELFTRGESLVVYGFMYAPGMERPCPMCTSILDGLEGNAHHIAQRTNLVVIAKSPIERLLAFARTRGWSRLKLLSSHDNNYNRDYHAETADGAQTPMLNVFRRDGGTIRHFYGTELLDAKAEPGQNSRHVDLIWPLWNVLDFTPEGRGSDWYPKLDY
ncbi:MAG: hypothetical protein A3G81_13145 [Betaproteobacteria bacterium RIFCSPLOWO2_12_FULL_65_14]|nr:MAG: hypothetical protein A3G81_13145 [Betaproteobacteria bacterium RIFCSPLOWO2_12_FULL_65_14]